jgi:hypothetical protein
MVLALLLGAAGCPVPPERRQPTPEIPQSPTSPSKQPEKTPSPLISPQAR